MSWPGQRRRRYSLSGGPVFWAVIAVWWLAAVVFWALIVATVAVGRGGWWLVTVPWHAKGRAP